MLIRLPATCATKPIARDTLDYVRRDLTDAGGGFYSAEDADSLTKAGGTEKAEGAFYVWTKKEIDDALGEHAELFDYQYGVEESGNAPEGSDPQGEFRSKNILYERQSFAETAKHFGRSELDVDESMRYRRATLLELRAKRPRPHLDDKIITAWNGLMISAFARGAQVLGDTNYLEAATRAAEFVRANLYDAKSHTLRRSYRGGPAEIGGFAEDYAFYIQGLLDLYEASFDVKWLRLAEQLQATQDRLFWDDKNGGYFTSTGDDPSILLRLKEDSDNAEPCPELDCGAEFASAGTNARCEGISRARRENHRCLCGVLESLPERTAADAGRAGFQPNETETGHYRRKTGRDGYPRTAAGNAPTLPAEHGRAPGRWRRRSEISRRQAGGDEGNAAGRWESGGLRLREFHLQSPGYFDGRAAQAADSLGE